jgi:hypothetical protein
MGKKSIIWESRIFPVYIGHSYDPVGNRVAVVYDGVQVDDSPFLL